MNTQAITTSLKNENITISITIKKTVLNNILTNIIIASLFIIGTYFAQFDLKISSYFFDNGFPLRGKGYVDFFNNYVVDITIGLFIYCLYKWYLYKKERSNLINSQKIKFLATSLLWWGCGFVHIIKAVFGRRRPMQVEYFGGKFNFTEFFQTSDQCTAGCSFVSGHSACALWVVALSCVLPQKYRKFCVPLSIFYALFVGYSRIAGGFHYFSDVYFAYLLPGLGMYFTYNYFIKNKEA
ncbi:MAG: phosphatase PAP2 family protein [Alphaproteobacteria bacterium]